MFPKAFRYRSGKRKGEVKYVVLAAGGAWPVVSLANINRAAAEHFPGLLLDQLEISTADFGARVITMRRLQKSARPIHYWIRVQDLKCLPLY